MAQTVALFLKANNEDITGDSTIESQDRKGSIECLSFCDSVRTAREKSTGMAVGRRTYEPVRFTKRIDSSSPLIAQALVDNKVIEATFKFFRPNPEGDGTTQHFFTVELKGGRVDYVRRESPDALDPAGSDRPPTEEIGLVFHEIIWTHVPTGRIGDDTWSEQK